MNILAILNKSFGTQNINNQFCICLYNHRFRLMLTKLCTRLLMLIGETWMNKNLEIYLRNENILCYIGTHGYTLSYVKPEKAHR